MLTIQVERKKFNIFFRERQFLRTRQSFGRKIVFLYTSILEGMGAFQICWDMANSKVSQRFRCGRLIQFEVRDK